MEKLRVIRGAEMAVKEAAKTGLYLYAIASGPEVRAQGAGGGGGMGLRGGWDVSNIFESFVTNHAELQVARDRFLGNYREPTQADKIEVGRLFDRLLKEDRERHTEKGEEIR